MAAAARPNGHPQRPPHAPRFAPPLRTLARRFGSKPHPFRPEGFTDWNPLVAEVKRTGIVVVRGKTSGRAYRPQLLFSKATGCFFV